MNKNILLLLILITNNAIGLTFKLPNNSDIIGSIQITTVQNGESFGEIGRKFDVGVYDMIEANPNFNPWGPRNGAKIVVPTKFILPKGPKKGIVINLAEMRIYYFHNKENLVSTYPIGIGKKGWLTPLGKSKIIGKQQNPTWRPPKSILLEHERSGDPLPKIVPPGPNNPLGKYALRLSMPGYLIHGTNRKGGIGLRSSSGCIRLFPEDIKKFFSAVAINTSVRIIHEPFKIGNHNNKIYIEIHQPLSDDYYNAEESYKNFMNKLQEIANYNNLDWPLTEQALDRAYGYPVPVQQKKEK